MVRLWLSAEDLANVRFADRMHPAGRVLLASQALRRPSLAAALPGPAGRAARHAAALRPLHHLLPVSGMAPDFLTPWAGLDSLDDGLDAIRSTPARQIRAEVRTAYARTGVSAARRRFAEADPAVLDSLVTSMRVYFDRVLAPDWAALNAAHRRHVGEVAGRYALSGVDGVLSALPAAIRWRAPVLEVDSWQDGDIRAGGHGLTLVPSAFAGPRPRLLVTPGRPALIVYPVDPPPLPSGRTAPDPLAGLLGRTRSAVLAEAARSGPATTSDIARRLAISVPSASEHLAVLRAAGLITSRRRGGAVLHRATGLGGQLLLAHPPGADATGA